MERSTIFNGKIHYFDWAIFDSFLYVYQAGYHFHWRPWRPIISPGHSSTTIAPIARRTSERCNRTQRHPRFTKFSGVFLRCNPFDPLWSSTCGIFALLNNEVQEKHFRRLDQSSNEIVLGVTRQRCFPKWTEIWRTLWQTRGPLSFRHFLFRESRKCADTMLELADLQRRLHVKFDSLKPSEGFCHDCAIHGCHATWGYQQALIHVFSIAEWRCVSQYFGSLCPTDRLR